MATDSRMVDGKQRAKWFNLEATESDIFRAERIADFLPEDAESCLDIGPAITQLVFRKRFSVYVTVDLQNADYNIDLMKESNIPIPDQAFDIVILSHILEHLPFPEDLVEEAKRISRRYIYVALPNEYFILARLRWLFALNARGEIGRYGHKYHFSIFSADRWVQRHVGPWYKRRYSTFRIGSFFRFAYYTGSILSRLRPSLFATETAYLFKLDSPSNNKAT